MIIKTQTVVLALLISHIAMAQSLYFPPAGDTWETYSPQELGWCEHRLDSLYQYLNDHQSKAFILLKDGKIVLEQYFNGHDAQTNWYWASAGKTLTAFMIGQAQREGLLSLSDTTSQYLGQGWTSCTPDQEDAITLRHQITMTSGLDDAFINDDCTLDSCLVYAAEAGSRWAYHNAPYTLLEQVMEIATAQDYNSYTASHILQPTGMQGFWVSLDYNNVFFSKARSMARFGLLMLAKGIWDDTDLLQDTAFFYQMTHASQDINHAYGYLTWLNHTTEFMLPEYQFVYPGNFAPSAPLDMFAAIGRDGQYICVAPSQNLVWIRMGENPDQLNVPILMVDDIWDYINTLQCEPSGLLDVKTTDTYIYPNPAQDMWHFQHYENITDWEIFDAFGKKITMRMSNNSLPAIDCSGLHSGLYFIKITHRNGKVSTQSIVKQ